MGNFINEYLKPTGDKSWTRANSRTPSYQRNYDLTKGWDKYDEALVFNAAVYSGGMDNPAWAAQVEQSRMRRDLEQYGDSRVISKSFISGIKNLAVTEGSWEDGARLKSLIDLATAPNLRKDDYKFAVKQLTKINQARKAKGIAQIDLLGTRIVDPVPKEYQPSTSKDIEKEVQKTLNAILKVASTGGQSVSESTQAYTNRLDEMGKLRVRGMFNAFSGVPLLPVSQQRTPTTYNPSLGGV